MGASEAKGDIPPEPAASAPREGLCKRVWPEHRLDRSNGAIAIGSPEGRHGRAGGAPEPVCVAEEECGGFGEELISGDRSRSDSPSDRCDRRGGASRSAPAR